MTQANPKPRPSRARKPKGEAGFAQNLAIEGETKTPDVIQAAYSRGFEDGEAIAKKIAANHSLTSADLRAKLDEVANLRAKLVTDLNRVDGALQVIGQLIEAVEAKGQPEAAA